MTDLCNHAQDKRKWFFHFRIGVFVCLLHVVLRHQRVFTFSLIIFDMLETQNHSWFNQSTKNLLFKNLFFSLIQKQIEK